jgi:hypothetical protein
VVIFLGAAFFFLTVDNPEAETAASTLLGGLELLKSSRSFSFKLGARPYAQRIPGRKSALITFGIPNSVCDQIAILAELWGASRSEAYNKSLRQGLVIYAMAQESVMIASRKRSKPAQIVMWFYMHLLAHFSVRNLGLSAPFLHPNYACLGLSWNTVGRFSTYSYIL